jgi:hypothetical protein
MHIPVLFTLVWISFQRVWGNILYQRTAKIPSHSVLATHVVDHKMTGINKAPDYVRKLKRLWPIRAREGKKGMYTFFLSP